MISPSTETTTDLELVLRIPGPWGSADELQEALPAEITLEESHLVLPDGSRFEWLARPMDADFPRIYATSCRQPPTDDQLHELTRAEVMVCLIGAGGSTQAVGQLMMAAAALLRVGGYGLFIDNSGRAHSAEDWIELAENIHDPDALTYAFVNVVQSRAELFTVGMHAFGLRDVAVVGDDPETSLNLITRLLGAMLNQR